MKKIFLICVLIFATSFIFSQSDTTKYVLNKKTGYQDLVRTKFTNFTATSLNLGKIKLYDQGTYGRLLYNSVENMRFNASYTTFFQNVNIGSISATKLLSVYGDISVTDDLFVTDDILSDALNNTRVGTGTGNALTTGAQNTYIGYQSGYTNIIGQDNTAVGWGTLRTSTVSSLTAFGSAALYSNTTGTNNTAVGYQALTTNTIGIYNTAVGDNALMNNLDGDNNTANGMFSLRSNTAGNDNTAIGGSSLYSNVTGGYNTASGFEAGYFNVGSENAFYGYKSGYGSGGTTNASTGNAFFGTKSGMINERGYGNTFIGDYSGYGNTSGTWNVFIGQDAGLTNTTGSNNTFLGRSAGYSNSIGLRNVFIGYNAGYYSTGSDSLYIENSLNCATPLLGGSFSLNKVTVNGDLRVTDTTFFGALTDSNYIWTDSPDLMIEHHKNTSPTYSRIDLTDNLITIGTTNNVLSIQDNLYTKIYGDFVVTQDLYVQTSIQDTIILGGDTIIGGTDLTVLTGNIGSVPTHPDTVFMDCHSNGAFMTCDVTVILADDATWSFPDAKTISYDIFVDGGDERAIGTIKADGSILIPVSCGTIVWDDADTDNDYCIYDGGGTTGVLKNRSGASATFYLTIRYNY